MTTAVTDFSQYTALRAQARDNAQDPALLREVAGQFEALFVETLLENMRAASLGDGLLDQGSQHEMYLSMLDQQLAVEMTREKGLGLAAMLVRQLERSSPAEAGDPQQTPQQGYAIGPRPLRAETPPVAVAAPAADRPADLRVGIDTAPVVARQIDAAAAAEPEAASGPWQSPREFVRDIWSHAKQAAERFGTDVRALVAQAALETGWGSHVIRHADGRNSFNLFGVKAGSDWTGGSVVRQTIEFRDGIAQREAARFRSYGSLADAFEDYARFLTGRARYGAAIASNSAEGFARGLQEAGYATDPDYADKIVRVMQSDTMRDAEQALKNERSAPIPDRYPARHAQRGRVTDDAAPAYTR
ncbi:MAG: flagellar assembly peptidoglycan hydrolase FlgJ [Woeseiaceae bacterium]|nr:flagellar assembly peptidoglycan hydrolase FlgJ [Woeseiaceae bacterium]